MSGCKNIQLYDTGVQTEYGDKFITMSTCEYSQKNGRMVIDCRKENIINIMFTNILLKR